MRYVKWTFWGLIALILFAFFDYTLPQHEVVRIVAATTQRMDLGENAWFYAAPDMGSSTSASAATGRDIKFIQTIKPNGRPMVFRNEDTGWGWPPYFKVNNFDLQTEASNLVSTEAAPKWVMVTRYGWRNQFFSIFPNAVRLRPVDSPDATVFPWVNVIILTLLAVLLFLIRRMWMQFRERTIDPVLGDMGDAWDRAEARADGVGQRARGFWSRLFGRR